MSSAFLKNETADAPVVIPARAPLPPGTPNYVTPHGLDLLRAELDELETQRAHVQTASADESNERSRQLALLTGRIANLNERIASAKVVDAQEQDRVRFGASVSLQRQQGTTAEIQRQFTIVGVDQANATQGLIAFTAPLARAMQGKQVGDTVTLPDRSGQQVFTIIRIAYNLV